MLQQNKLAWQKLLSFEENDTCVLTVILTRFCNLRCLHCNISEWLDNKTESLFDLNDFEIFINRLKQRGKKKFFLNLIGGEVLTKFDRVQSFLNKFSEYQFGITTNLVKLPDDYQSLKNVSINVSLDGLPEDHDKIRGKGMFKKTYKNISILKKEDYRINYIC
jgi:MoaA/NifB/PqqE/SkfB family radical SAM enzyme